MQKHLTFVVFAIALGAGGAGCSSHREPIDPSEPESQSSSSPVIVPEQCQAVMSIEVVHRVNGSQVTDKVRLTPDARHDPEMALRSFQVAADYFGAANIVSSRPLSEVHCFPQQTAAIRPVANLAGDGLCADPTGIIPCPIPEASHTYSYGGTDNCSLTNYGEGAVSFSCDDSKVIVSKQGDVVLTLNTQNFKEDVLQRTQVLRKLVADANIITNFHFDIQINPNQQAAIVQNSAFGNIAQQLKQAADQGLPLPDIHQILQNLPTPPTNIEFYTELVKAYKTQLDRLELLANITNGALLSPTQVAAFHQNFVGKSKLVDKLIVEASASSMSQAKDVINDTINQLASTDKSSTIYQQVKAGAQSLLDAQTCKGVFDPDRTVDLVPDLYKSLTDDDIEKRLIAAEELIYFNETIRRSDGASLVEATAGLLGLLVKAMDHDDMERVWRIVDRVQAGQYFFDNDNPAGSSYDVHLTPGAKAMFNIDVQPNSAIAYEVINLLNETYDYNAATGKVTINYNAIITINARSALSTSDAIRALYHVEESYGVLDFLKDAGSGFVFGIVKEVGNTAVGIVETTAAVLSDPVGAYEHLKYAVVNWRQTLALVWQQGAEVIHRWPNMTVQEKAELMGRLTTQLLLTFPPEVRGAGRMSEALEEAVRIHFREAETGLRIMERGGVVLSEEAAVELAKRMKQLEVTALDEMVQIADGLDDALPCSLVGVGAGAHGAILAAGAKPPCLPSQIGLRIADLYAEARRLGAVTEAELADLTVASAKSGLRGIGTDLWESRAGLRYGADANYGNRVQHVLRHGVDDPTRVGAHGVFDGGRRNTLSVIDEAWQKAMREGESADVHIVQQANGWTRYEVDMGRRVGYVGGQAGAAAGHPPTNRVFIVIKNLRDIVTAFPSQ